MTERQLEAVVVGGSIAGLSVAHALLKAGCKVTVLERAAGKAHSAGAGLGLDRDACDAVASFGLGEGLQAASIPLPNEEVRAVVGKEAIRLHRDESYDHRAAHWRDLYSLLADALPPGIVRYHHEVTGFEELPPGGGRPTRRVRVEAVVDRDPGNVETLEGDFMVACDGAESPTRRRFVPDDRKRYCGYVAWRGVFEYDSRPEIAAAVREGYPGLGDTLYFDLAPRTHAVLYELPGDRLNWLWYARGPEPDPENHKATIHEDEKAVAEMKQLAADTWTPPLATLIQSTSSPFVNAIYDKEPLSRFVWGRVALVGEAAHPVSPHGLRSTNMSIVDAATLGKCLSEALAAGRGSHEEEGGEGDAVEEALREYERARVPVARQQVLFSRHLGQLKQGMLFEGAGGGGGGNASCPTAGDAFPWPSAGEDLKAALALRNMDTWRCPSD